ncbi:MAG: 1-acyl-sn-glycerol-3-phosphate acyltransferase [Bacteroidota bacterium]
MAERKTSVRYSLLRLWVKLGLHIYFREIEVVGKEKVPKNVPVLFAVNHPNTALDALLTACFSPRHPWFLARGDVFRRDFMARIFRAFRMMPVYRERDGVAQVKENTEVFSKSARILARGGSLIMFPEGSHNRQWRIRDLRRGLARIATETVERNPDLVVIPVGITYFDPTYAFSDVLVQFGDPIKVSEVIGEPAHPVHRQDELMKLIGERLEEITLHIGDADYEDIYKRVKYLEQHEPGAEKLRDDFARLKKWIDECQNDPACGKAKEGELLKTVSRKTFPLIALIVTLPFWLIGKVFTIVPQLIIYGMVKKLKDDHFTGAVQFIAGLVMYTVLFIGIGVWSWFSTLTLFWFILKWGSLTFCMFFVMLWEEHFQNFRDRRFSRS